MAEQRQPPRFVMLDDKYRCVKCHEILQEPMQTECGHRMCRKCVDALLQDGSRAGRVMCPAGEEDCCSIAQDNIFPDFSCERELKRIVVSCPICEMPVESINPKKHLEECQGRSSSRPASGAATAPENPLSSNLREAETQLANWTKKKEQYQNDFDNHKKMLEDLETRLSQLERTGSRTLNNHETLIREVQTEGSLSEINSDVLRRHEQRLSEHDLRMQILTAANYSGTLIWKIGDYRRRKAAAVSGDTRSIHSPPFFTSRHGYRMCARMYLNGDGMGRGTHLSLFFVVMRGEYDALLSWPFRQSVNMSLLDQTGGDQHVTETFRPDPNSSSFKRPVSEMNIASGCPLFVQQSTVEEPMYLKDDTIFLKMTVETTDLDP